MAIDYEALLGQSQGMYNTILGGYNTALAQQQANQQNIMAGYNSLQSTVLGDIAGAGRARSQEIADQYTARAGQEMQSLISRGLGNTTVQSSVGRGLTYDQTKSQNQLAEQVAMQRAQYQSQLGLAGLGYQNTANQQNMALLGQQLDYSGGWQQNLLGAAMSGLGRKEQFDNQQRLAMLGSQGGGGIVRSSGGGGGGGSYGGGGPRMQWGAPSGPGGQAYNNDPWINIGGQGGGGMGQPIVHPGNFAAASLVGDVLGAGLSGGGFDALGGLAAMATDGGGSDWYAGLEEMANFWE
jgi:uncharacterized membrane protein YgcG